MKQVLFSSHGKIVTMYVHENEHIGNIISNKHNFYEMSALDYVGDRVVMRDRIVLDIGANIGNHSIYFSVICGAKVVAMEPNRENYAVLLRNSVGKNIIPMNVLAGDGGGYGEVSVNPSNMGMCKYSKNDNSDMLSIRIDNLGLSEVSLIKIDVEGMELDVLSGAEKTIAKYSPAIMIEIDNNKNDILKFLESRNYYSVSLSGSSDMVLARKAIL